MNTIFKDFIFQRLPSYFKRYDTNKDVNGKGTLERYLEIFGEELDEEIIPLLENHLSIVDSQNCSEEFLIHISDTLGNPPDINLDLQQYRNILSFIVSHYKLKGTVKGYEFFFNLLNFDIAIVEIPYNEAFYDNGEIYDTPTLLEDYHYDNQCPTCSYYTIEFANKADSNNNIAPITPGQLNDIRLAIDFNEPINAKLLSLMQSVALVDNINACIQEEVIINTITTIEYDDSLLYDDNEMYDENGAVLVSTETSSSPYCSLIGPDFNNDFNNDFNI